MKIGLLQLNSTIGDFSSNVRALTAAYQRACERGAEFVVAPEMFVCGYPPRDLLLRADFIEQNLAALDQAAAGVGDVPLCVGFVDRNAVRPGKPLCNSAALLQDGKVAQKFRKSLLPSYDVFDEARYFEPATAVVPGPFKGRRLGITICEDIWNDEDFWPERLYRRDPVKELIALGAEVIINLSASPWHLGKEKTRLAMLRKVAADERIPLLQVNLVGANDELIFDGHSVALDSQGGLIALAKGFAEDLLVVDITQSAACHEPGRADLPVGQDPRWRVSASFKADDRAQLEQAASSEEGSQNYTNRSAGSLPASFATNPSETRADEPSALLLGLAQAGSEVKWPEPEQQLFSALSLGIRDYVRKCGFKSVVCGLSGGIDSALTAVLAVDALGAQHVTGVAMPSRFSSEGSLNDAAALARNLGIRFEVLPIESAVHAVEQQLAGVFAGLSRNEAEENIQSRLRGVTLMALSNKFGSLVLTTGNKSELSVGYCTLYGDMCGALAVIADLLKTEIYRIARWINREQTIIPEDCLTKAPSAELRPNQKDQDSLPEYELLDAILSAYVVQDLSREEIIARGFDPAVVKDVINKVTFSEYKRRQAAPGLKVSPRAFGMGRRIPIAQRFRT